MLIPATKLANYALTFPIYAYAGDAQRRLTREEFEDLCSKGAIVATGSFKKIRRFQIITPNPRALHMQRRQREAYNAMRRVCNLQSEASKTVLRQSLITKWVWKHHAERCSAAQPHMEPVGKGAL